MVFAVTDVQSCRPLASFCRLPNAGPIRLVFCVLELEATPPGGDGARSLGVGRIDDEFDLELWPGQFRLTAGTCGRMTSGHPSVPNFVQPVKILHVGQPDRDTQHVFA